MPQVLDQHRRQPAWQSEPGLVMWPQQPPVTEVSLSTYPSAVWGLYNLRDTGFGQCLDGLSSHLGSECVVLWRVAVCLTVFTCISSFISSVFLSFPVVRFSLLCSDDAGAAGWPPGARGRRSHLPQLACSTPTYILQASLPGTTLHPGQTPSPSTLTALWPGMKSGASPAMHIVHCSAVFFIFFGA